MEVSTLILKHITGYAERHPGWSHTQIAATLDDEYPDLVDELFTARRAYILNQWVTRAVSDYRVGQRDKLKSGEIIAALSPDGKGRLYKLGDMTGTHVVELGERYIASGTRLVTLGEFYVKVGTEAGRRKVKSVFTEDRLRTMYEGGTG